jgi:hypothetical protein
MKKIVFIAIATILLIIIIIYLCSGNINYSKNELSGTRKIENGLYLEIYRVYGGGVYGGDVRTVYLTDSTNFRRYIGKQFDDELVRCSMIDNDMVLIYKLDWHTENSLENKMYRISQLKKEGKWE